MIKALVFDMGGVLLKLDMDRCIGKFKSEAGFSNIESYLDKFKQKGFIGDLEAGIIDEQEFYRQALAHCTPGLPSAVVRECFESLLDGLNMDVVGALPALARKYPLYLLTNNNPISRRAFDRLMSEIGLDSSALFTRSFYSFEMKMLKPSREFFLSAVEQTGLDAGQILFIDDSPVNCRAAAELGIQTLLYVPGLDITEEIDSL